MRSAWVGLALFVIACSEPERPVVPKHPEPEPEKPAPPIVAAAKPPVIEQKFTPTPAPAFADPDRRAKLAAAFPKLDKELEQLRADQHVLGISVGVVIDGELAYSKGFGVVDPTTKAVPDADTVYRIGSISKSFTGLALLSLRDEGKVDLDDPLAKWIPEANALTYTARDARPITLRQLAQHTSGLPRDGAFDMEADPSEATVVGSLAKVTLERAPGLESVYSNLGFGLLGIVASHAAKQSLHELVTARIFQPLGMTSSGYTPPSDHLAPAFADDGKPKKPAKLGALDGAGGIYSNVRDMARYAAFLLAAYPPRDDDDRGPIKRSTIREAQHSGFAMAPQASLVTDAKPGEPTIQLDAMSYGFGWLEDLTCTSTDKVWHNGAVDSYRAELALRTDRGVGVIVLTNSGGANASAFSDRVLRVLDATGAMKPREPGLPDASTYTPVMTAFLDAYNTQDKAKLAAVIARPLDPREPDEIAGYKAMHGACSAFKLTGVVNNGLRFAMTCEHGPFELDINTVGDKLRGFTGRTPGASPTGDAKKVIAAALAIYSDPAWSDANYKLAFPKHQLAEDRVKGMRANLRADFGTCKPTSTTQEGLGWSIELTCAKGAKLDVSIQLDKNNVIDNIFFRPARGTEPPRCPTK
ncbi:MAG TPA: serine hydrolase domain-containing protein [Kofleriaceae bacterium]|jgi:CubicO group peptidase (beta-lactamase class C family)